MLSESVARSTFGVPFGSGDWITSTGVIKISTSFSTLRAGKYEAVTLYISSEYPSYIPFYSGNLPANQSGINVIDYFKNRRWCIANDNCLLS